MKRWLLSVPLLAVVLGLVSLTARGGVERQASPILFPVEAKVTRAAETFDLKDVSLLDSPFREAMLRDQEYILSIEPDRLLHAFRLNAGLTTKAEPLGGWEAPEVELRGHSLGHYLSACALMYRSTGDGRFKKRADGIVSELAKVQQALARRGAHEGYLSAFPESFIDRVEARQKVWAPYYTLHKIMAGLLDAYLLCENQQALDVVARMAGWVQFRMDRLSTDRQQQMLETEFGGMAEVLANLYGVTGNLNHLRVARLFDHQKLFEPLAKGLDPLDGLHGNTQIPKIIGAVRECELSGQSRYYDIAKFFWQRVALNRSFAIGGNTDDELFFPVKDFAEHLGSSTAETCNTYNMLKLTKALFRLAPSAAYMDFFERALFNHILPSQDPATGMVMYYCPLKPGAFRTFSTPYDSFWCCVGTGMENHAKYGDAIYAHHDNTLWVNLFVPSEVAWREQRATVRQETTFPREDGTRLTVTLAKPTKLRVLVRYPKWAEAGMLVSINGEPQDLRAAKPGSYVALERTWTSGDVVAVRMPMNLHLEPLPTAPNTVAVMYGPIVLAADLGKDGLDTVKRYGPSVPQMGRVQATTVPVFVGDARDIVPSIAQVPGRPLEFTTQGPGRSRTVTLRPFNEIFDSRYSVYWQIYSPDEWKTRMRQIASTDDLRSRAASGSIDVLDVSDAGSEAAHGLASDGSGTGEIDGRKYRESKGRWFSYTLRVLPDEALGLICTFRGSEGNRRVFDIIVDGEKLKTETLLYHPTELFDLEYTLPRALTRGKDRVTVKFQAADADAWAGGLVEMRTVRR